MSERGLIGISALWLMVAISSLALSVLSLAKWNLAEKRNQADEVKMILLAETAAANERESNFSSEKHSYDWPAGRVELSRVFSEANKSCDLRCSVTSGKSQKKFQIEWLRVGDDWRALTWREE